MEWVAKTLHTTSEHGVSSITTADAHTSAASSRLNRSHRRFKWTRPFHRKTRSGFCACAVTFQTQSNSTNSITVNAQQTTEGLVHQTGPVLHHDPGTGKHFCRSWCLQFSMFQYVYCPVNCDVLYGDTYVLRVRLEKRSCLKRCYLTTRSHDVTCQNVKISIAKAVKISGITAVK